MSVQLPQRIEDVVVVVHNNDIDLFCLQLQSFELFLEPCKLNIVVNEDDITKCYKRIKSYLLDTKHKVKIWSRKEIIGNDLKVPGWTSQQLLKLLIPLKRDWIVFDSKDILIRPVTLLDLDKKQFKNYEDLSLKDPQGLFWQGLLKLGEEQGFPVVDPSAINQNQTPRVIDNRVIRKIHSIFGGKQNFIDWFCSFDVQGEFILHDYLTEVMQLEKKIKFPMGFIHGVWYQHIYDSVPFGNISDNVHIYKCHRRVYNIENNRNEINKWIKRVFKTYKEYRKALKNEQ
jgi:hypothetical protein